MSAESPQSLTVGYWSIRGLAAPLRMMVMYRGVTLNAENYDCVENETKNGFDHSSWFSVKPQLKAKNPLINLPYVIDGDVVVTQSNACFAYLGRKLGLMGKDLLELTECEQLLCEIMDLRNHIIPFVYGPVQGDELQWFAGVSRKGGSLDKLNLWLERKYAAQTVAEDVNVFFVGDDATAPDFHIWEILDQLRLMASFYNAQDPLAHFPMLAAFHASFAKLPNNQRYFASKLAKLPCNNMMAGRFGATPSGARWVFGSENTWVGSAGQY
eukprot:TRINITY_DN3043_c0_g3_i1.p1 TRINITY_DN3043_c0_g3~~TRINITY_DN3043_c0_g3_i1.p1  ORF type:complete len:303 (-),score=103.71 TRINITY_DN3043_c0_g3_i1:132-938(-)